MRYVSIDIETTGLDPETCQTIEFGAVIEDTDNHQALECLPSFHRYVNTHHEAGLFKGEPYALSMHGEIFKRIATRDPKYRYNSPDTLASDFRDFLFENHVGDKIVVAGKNFAGFDLRFLRKLRDWDYYIKIHHRIIDPSILFWQPLDMVLPDTKECKIRAGISGEVAHTAIADCIDVIKLVRVGLLKKMMFEIQSTIVPETKAL